MDKQNYLMSAIIIALLIFISVQTIQSSPSTIDVSGESIIEVNPDKAIIYMSYSNIADNVNLAQKDNEEVMIKVKNSILNYVDSKDIETTNFNIYENKEWINEVYVSKGYKAIHSLKITLNNVNLVSSLINAATSSGINNIENVQYELTKEGLEQAKLNAYSSAMSSAKSKAENIAKASRNKLGKLISVTESSSSIPYRDYLSADLKSESGFSPKDVTVRVNLNTRYEIR